MHITVNGLNANIAENMRYRGAGMVTGNNSSRLLLDYKSENPKAYWEILNHIFGEKGVGVTHLKIEMGSDINSSSGTEPCVKRNENEIADVTRGAGYQLAADAKIINPELTLDMLWCGVNLVGFQLHQTFMRLVINGIRKLLMPLTIHIHLFLIMSVQFRTNVQLTLNGLSISRLI